MSKPRRPQKQDINKVSGRDCFSTPNYAIDLLIPFIPILHKNTSEIWECAAGERKISDRLEYHGYRVLSTDIRGLELEGVTPTNFITDRNRTDVYSHPTVIITNPPYSLKIKFFKKCIEYGLPFALLISGDYSMWVIDAIRKYGCEKIIPSRRIDFITPSGKSGATGQSSYFHSYWLTRFFNLGKSETFVELTNEMKKNI